MFSISLVTPITFINGVLAGIFVCSSMVEHAVRNLQAPSWIVYKKAKENVFGPIMPVIFLGGLIGTFVTAAVLPAHVPLAIAAIMFTSAFAITLTVHLPLNSLFQTWTPDSYPVNWEQGRQRWRRWNVIRTVLVVIAFCATLAVSYSALRG